MTQKFNRLKILPGLSLIEVMVSLAVLGLLAVALISTTLITQKGARAAKADAQATKLIQEYSEEIRIFRDRKGFSSLANTNTTQATCINSSNFSNPESWVLTTAGCPEQKTLDKVTFTRELSIADTQPLNVKRKQVTIKVTWNDSGGTQKREHVLILSDCVQTSC